MLEVLPRSRILAPDDAHGKRSTLRAAVAGRGWPTLGEARGKCVFLLASGAQLISTDFPEANPRWPNDVVRLDARRIAAEPADTVAESCAAESVSLPNFYDWKRRLARKARTGARPAAAARPGPRNFWILESLLPDEWTKSHPDSIRTFRIDEKEQRAATRRFTRAVSMFPTLPTPPAFRVPALTRSDMADDLLNWFNALL